MSAAVAPIFVDAEIRELLGDDPELLAIADAIAETRPLGRGIFRRYHPVLIAAAAVLLIAAPAYALLRSVVNFSASPPAAGVVVKQFGYLNEAAPIGMSPAVGNGEARHVADFKLLNGSTLALSVAPTKDGGFCEDLGGMVETCDASRTVPVAIGSAEWKIADGWRFVFGDVLSADAARVELRWRDGRTVQVPLIRVSSPIDASFYFYPVTATDDWPVTATAITSDGKFVAQSPPTSPSRTTP
jgi:hypothetical protein